MNFGTRRSDEGCTELGALVMAGLVMAGLVIAGLVIAGLGTWAVGVRATVLVVELLEAVGVCNVGAVEGAVALAQPARANMSAVAPARDIATYRRGCLTWTNSNEPTNAVIGVRHNGTFHDRRHTGNPQRRGSEAERGAEVRVHVVLRAVDREGFPSTASRTWRNWRNAPRMPGPVLRERDHPVCGASGPAAHGRQVRAPRGLPWQHR